jgi:YgiT-type zinc finger domain-containing protein
MKCPICAKAELIQDVREIPYTYNVENTTSPAVPGLWRGHPRSDRRRAYAS